MKHPSFHLFIFISLFISGCKVVSTKDAKSIQALAGTIKTTASAPGEFVKQYYDLIIDVQKLKLAIRPTDTLLVNSLDNVVVRQRQEDALLKGYNAGYTVLSSYSDLLLALTSDTTAKTLKKQGDAFVAAFDTAIVKYNGYTGGTKLPVNSLGGVVSKLILEIGTRRIKYLQRKYLVDLVTRADSIIQLISDNYIIIDHTRDSTTIRIDRTDVKNTFGAFLFDLRTDPGGANSYNRYKDYEPIYYNWNYKLDALQALDQSNTVAFKKMKNSHAQLLDALKKKITFSAFLSSVKDWYGSVNDINESFKKLEKDLTPKK